MFKNKKKSKKRTKQKEMQATIENIQYGLQETQYGLQETRQSVEDINRSRNDVRFGKYGLQETYRQSVEDINRSRNDVRFEKYGLQETRQSVEDINRSRNDVRFGNEYPSRWYSTGDLKTRLQSGRSFNNLCGHYRPNELDELRQNISQSNERLDRTEKQLSRTEEQLSVLTKTQYEANQMVMKMYSSLESLVQKTDDDVFYKRDDDNSDVFTESPHKSVLKDGLLEIKEIQINSLLDKMVTKMALEQNDEESIRGQKTNESRVRRFVRILASKPPKTFETFLQVLSEDQSYSGLHDILQRKYTVAKMGTQSRCCAFCYITGNVDIRQIADYMYNNKSLNNPTYGHLTNNYISETEKWQFLRNITPKVSETRNGFINALEDKYPAVREKLQSAFSWNDGNLTCTCTNRHRRLSRNSEPRTLKKSTGTKIAQDMKQCKESYEEESDLGTISNYLKNDPDNKSDMPDSVVTNVEDEILEPHSSYFPENMSPTLRLRTNNKHQSTKTYLNENQQTIPVVTEDKKPKDSFNDNDKEKSQVMLVCLLLVAIVSVKGWPHSNTEHQREFND